MKLPPTIQCVVGMFGVFIGGFQVHAISFKSLLVPPIPTSRSYNTAWIDISPARIPQDLSSIRECRQSCWNERKPGQRISPRFLNADAVSEPTVTCILARETWYPWRILGTADVRVNDNTGIAHVTNVYVREEARGKGLGKRLMSGIDELVADETIRIGTMCLDVNTQNVAAISLYQRCGYSTPGIHSVVSLVGKYTGLDLQIAMKKEISKI